MNWIINHSFDLARGHVQPHFITNALVEVGDENSHAWNVTLTQNGSPADLGGASVVGYFIRADGATVPVTGSVSGNVATVVPAQACFAVEGDLTAVMKITLSDVTLTVDAFVLHVRKDITDSYVDPGEVIPSLQELLAKIDDCEAATEAATAAAQAASQEASVKYNAAQSLTDAQKEQARTNIGAANGELDKMLEPVGLKEYVLTVANVPMNGLLGYLRLSNTSSPGKISSSSSYIVYWFEAWSDMIITGIDTYIDGAIGIRVSNEEPVLGVGSSSSWTGVLYDTYADNMPTADSPAAVSKGQYVTIGQYVQSHTRSWALHVQISIAEIPTLAASLPASTFLNAYYDNMYLKRGVFDNIFGLIDYEQGFGDMSFEYDDTLPEGSDSGRILGIERKGMVVTLNSRVVSDRSFKVHLSGEIYRMATAKTFPHRIQFRTGHKYRVIVKYLSGNFIQKDDSDPVAPATCSVYSTASPNATVGVLVLNELMNGGVYIREVDGDDDMYNLTLYCQTNLGTFHDYKVLVLLQDVTDGGVFKYLFGNDLLASAQALILENN